MFELEKSNMNPFILSQLLSKVGYFFPSLAKIAFHKMSQKLVPFFTTSKGNSAFCTPINFLAKHFHDVHIRRKVSMAVSYVVQAGPELGSFMTPFLGSMSYIQLSVVF